MSKWTKAKLGDLVDINPSKRDQTWPYDYIDYVDISSVEEGYIATTPKRLPVEDAPSRAQRTLSDGDTVISTVRPNRRSMFLAKAPSSSLVASTGFAVLRPKKDLLHPRFLYSLVYNPAFTEYLIMREQGAAYPAVSPGDFASAVVHLPPYEEQENIAQILGSLDDKIELNRRMSATLEEMARAIFKSWFIDFDPVHAKAEGRPTGLPPELDALFPDSFQDSELGPIPTGWEIDSLTRYADIGGGSTPSTKNPEFWDDGAHHWATPKDLSRLSTPVLLDTERKITDAGLKQISSGLYPAGTVLMSSRAPIGYLAVSKIPIAVNQGFIALVPKADCSFVFILRWLEAHMDAIHGRANGSTFMEISKSSFKTISTVLPPVLLVKAFQQIADPLFERLVNGVVESSALTQIRDSLLPRLIAGEIKLGADGIHD